MWQENDFRGSGAVTTCESATDWGAARRRPAVGPARLTTTLLDGPGATHHARRVAKSKRVREALPDFKGASISIGGFMAGLEQQILHKRPPAAIVVEEEARSEPRSINGLQLGGPDEPIERPEPPDTSGARI
jgi:hypothetical protein